MKSKFSCVRVDVPADGKPSLSAVQKSHLELIASAIKLFYRYDGADLWGESRAIDERSMVGCVYRYMYHLMESGRCGVEVSDIDIEYDRMHGKNSVDVKKSLDNAEVCKKCSCFKGCMSIVKEMRKKRCETPNCNISHSDEVCDVCENLIYKIRPDIIVHERRDNKNILVAEFKKRDCNGQALVQYPKKEVPKICLSERSGT